MTANFTGTTANEIGYGIHADFTPNISLPTVEYGDVNAVGLVTKAFTEIDRRIYFRGAMLSMTGDQAISATTNTVIDLETVAYDQGGWIATVADGFFTVPSGVAKIRVAFSVKMTTTVTATAAFSVLKNGSGSYAGALKMRAPDTHNADTFAATSAAVAVSAGDTIKLNAYLSVGNSIDVDGTTWFAIEAVELSNAS